jgi:hypothetical protein
MPNHDEDEAQLQTTRAQQTVTRTELSRFISFTNHYALTGTTLTWSSTGPQSETPSVTLVW